MDLLAYGLENCDGEGHIVEFGVYKGDTISFLASRVKKVVHGFDSFEGLPEGSIHWTKGVGNLGGVAPEVPQNVVLHRGWFDRTIPEFLKDNDGHVSFIHVDCDIYSSTKTIFDLLAERITEGTAIVFDEFFGHPNWHCDEFRAFREFTKMYDVDYRYIGYGSKCRVCVRINRLSP